MKEDVKINAQCQVKKYKRRFRLVLFISIILSIVFFVVSISFGRAGITNPILLVQSIFGENKDYLKMLHILENIRIPRACAAFLVGSSLATSGLAYQNTFNNKLVSPDILGVSSGCCVGAGIAILFGMSVSLIRVMAFLFGFVSVLIAISLPKLFRNYSALILVLSGIIVGAFMDSIISLIKYVADKEEKLSEITFWIMGSLVGIQFEDIWNSMVIYIVPFMILIIMGWRINIISLGFEEAESLGINYRRCRLIIIICATFLTANCVSISGNIGWVGLVIPHISRAFVGDDARVSLPIAAVCGGLFLMIVDTLSRLVSVNEIPLSIITGLIGAIVYSIVLAKRGRYISG